PFERDVGFDVQLRPVLAGVRRDPGQRLLGNVTQVAAGPGDEREPAGALFPAHRSAAFRTLPVAECGSASTNSMAVGHLNLARLGSQGAPSSSGLTEPEGTTNALTVCPVNGCGTPSTAASRTAGCAISTCSTSYGYTLNPLTRISSRSRSTRNRSPSASA